MQIEFMLYRPRMEGGLRQLDPVDDGLSMTALGFDSNAAGWWQPAGG